MKKHKIGFVASLKPKFMQRRRGRQIVDSGGRSWTIELAELRLQLLIAMADADGEIVELESEAIHEVADSLPLGPDDRAELSAKVDQWLQRPPDPESLFEPLKQLVGVPALGRALVTDLARVAAADRRADPNEARLLLRLCTALDIPPIKIPVADPTEAEQQRRAVSVEPTDPRIREAVRRALNESYAKEAARNAK